LALVRSRDLGDVAVNENANGDLISDGVCFALSGVVGVANRGLFWRSRARSALLLDGVRQFMS
jgi:hypothetical protein